MTSLGLGAHTRLTVIVGQQSKVGFRDYKKKVTDKVTGKATGNFA